MRLARWLIPIFLAAAGGVCVVNYLTVHPLDMSAQLLLASLALFGGLVWLIWQFQGKRLVAASVLCLIAFVCAYLLHTNVILAREDTRYVPPLTRVVNDPGDGHTAVIYFTHGEPQTYDPIGWLNQFREFDKQGIPFVPVFARPLFIYELRNAYLKVGQSHHHAMHVQMMKCVEQALQADGYRNLKVYLAFLDDEPRPDAAVIQALNEGASQIVAAEVFVSISNHTAEGEELIERVKAEDYGVPVKFTGPLWNSNTLQRAFIDKADAAIGSTDKSKVGVLLVGHGQPDEWDVDFPTETQQELQFRQDILSLFVADGYRPENLSLAWMEFKAPSPVAQIEKLVQQGVEKIIYFSAAISADSIHSQYDVPELVQTAKVPDGFPLINLGAWDDHPLVIRAITEKIEPLLPASAKSTAR